MTVDTPALADVLADIPVRALPERLSAVRGTVRYETPREASTLRFADGRVSPVDDDRPDVVVRARAEVLADVVAGRRNAGMELLRGTLDLEGDTDLALAMGAMFGLDPRALDPVEVAVVLGEVRSSHVERVMRSGFRAVVLSEVFGRLPDFVDPVRAATVDLVVGFRLTGHPSGELERYVVTVREGTATVVEGEPGGRRDATITCQGHDFLRLATGHLNPLVGVLRGRLKVRGDRARALELTGVLDIPSAGGR